MTTVNKTKVCPHCNKEKNTRGFSVHMEYCKAKQEPIPEMVGEFIPLPVLKTEATARTCPYCQDSMPDGEGYQGHFVVCREKWEREVIRKRYAKDTKEMSPFQKERFLNKAWQMNHGR